MDIAKGLPAEKAGIKVNDVVLEVLGKPIGSDEDFRVAVSTTPVSTTL